VFDTATERAAVAAELRTFSAAKIGPGSTIHLNSSVCCIVNIPGD
jgi:hypothetical protein